MSGHMRDVQRHLVFFLSGQLDFIGWNMRVGLPRWRDRGQWRHTARGQ